MSLRGPSRATAEPAALSLAQRSVLRPPSGQAWLQGMRRPCSCVTRVSLHSCLASCGPSAWALRQFPRWKRPSARGSHRLEADPSPACLHPAGHVAQVG